MERYKFNYFSPEREHWSQRRCPRLENQIATGDPLMFPGTSETEKTNFFWSLSKDLWYSFASQQGCDVLIFRMLNKWRGWGAFSSSKCKSLSGTIEYFSPKSTQASDFNSQSCLSSLCKNLQKLTAPWKFHWSVLRFFWQECIIRILLSSCFFQLMKQEALVWILNPWKQCWLEGNPAISRTVHQETGLKDKTLKMACHSSFFSAVPLV